MEHITYTDKSQQKAQSVGIQYANSLFEKMKNPDFRGLNFHWETSWQGFSEVAASSLFTSFTDIPSNLDELEDICRLAFKTQWFSSLEKIKLAN